MAWVSLRLPPPPLRLCLVFVIYLIFVCAVMTDLALVTWSHNKTSARPDLQWQGGSLSGRAGCTVVMVSVKQPGLEHVQDQGDGCEFQQGEAEVP